MKNRITLQLFLLILLVSCASPTPETVPTVSPTLQPTLTSTATQTPSPTETIQPTQTVFENSNLFIQEANGVGVESSEDGIEIIAENAATVIEYSRIAILALNLSTKEALELYSYRYDEHFRNWSEVENRMQETRNFMFDPSIIKGVRTLKYYGSGSSETLGDKSFPIPLEKPLNLNELEIRILNNSFYEEYLATGRVDDEYLLSPYNDIQNYENIRVSLTYELNDNGTYYVPTYTIYQTNDVAGFGFPKRGERIEDLNTEKLDQYIRALITTVLWVSNHPQGRSLEYMYKELRRGNSPDAPPPILRAARK